MKKKTVSVLFALLLIAAVVLGVAACKDKEEKPEGGNGGGTTTTPSVTITPETPLSDVAEGLKSATNYTVAMSYSADGVTQNLEISVTQDKIVDTLSYVKADKQIVEVTACTKEGDKYFEYVNRTVTDAPAEALATAGETAGGELVYIPSPLNTKREVTKEYFDRKYGDVAEVYIPLMDPVNYEKGADNKYKLKEEKAAEFAGKMSASVADVKKISIEIKDGQVALNAPGVTIAGKSNISVEIKDVGNTAAELKPEMTAAQAEKLNISNAYARFKAGGVDMVTQYFRNGVKNGEGKGYYWVKGGNTECYGYSSVPYGNVQGKAYFALYTEDGKYVMLENSITDTITHSKKYVSYATYKTFMNSQLSMVRLMLSPDFWVQTPNGYEHLTTPEAKQKCMALWMEVMTEMNAESGYLPDWEGAENFYNQFVAGSTLEISGETATFMVWSDAARSGGYKYIMTNFGSCAANLPDEVKNAPFASTEMPAPIPDEKEPLPGVEYDFETIGSVLKNSYRLTMERDGGVFSISVDGEILHISTEEKGGINSDEYYLIKDGKYYYCNTLNSPIALNPVSKSDYDSGFEMVKYAIELLTDRKNWQASENGYALLPQYKEELYYTLGFGGTGEATLKFTSDGFKMTIDGSDGGSLTLSDIGLKLDLPENVINAPKAIIAEIMFATGTMYTKRANIFYDKESDIRQAVTDFVSGLGLDIADLTITGLGASEVEYDFTETHLISIKFKQEAEAKYARVSLDFSKDDEQAAVYVKKGNSLSESFLREYIDKFFGATYVKAYIDSRMTSAYGFGAIGEDTVIYVDAILEEVPIVLNLANEKGFAIRIKQGESVDYAQIKKILLEQYKFDVTRICTDAAMTQGFTSATPQHKITLYIDGQSTIIRFNIMTANGGMTVEFDKSETISFERLSQELSRQYGYSLGKVYTDENKTVEFDFTTINRSLDEIELYDESFLSPSERFVVYVETDRGGMSVEFNKNASISYEQLSSEVAERYGFTLGKLYTDENKTIEFDFATLDVSQGEIRLFDESLI